MSSVKWSGRFNRPLAPEALEFSQSIHFDSRLYLWDIIGSLAHARALARAGLLTQREEQKIARGLKKIRDEIGKGRIKLDPRLEDIHRNIEVQLIRRIGPVGGKLHTGRSRNDQVATDLRLYLRSALTELFARVRALQETLVAKAKAHRTTILPGFTHLQHAQPVVLAHHLMAYYEMLERDADRVREAFRRSSVLPLGSGALAGTGFPIDRGRLAKELNFPSVSRNSLDGVSDRDFVVDTLHVCNLIMVHLSRLAEELILWATPEFGYIKLPEEFATGSSMMPQKVNPDIPELVRGRVGRVAGHYITLTTVLKGLPLSYNRDLQEDKEPLFDSLDTTLASLRVMERVMARLIFNVRRLLEAAEDGSMWATDIADWLVSKAVPFRKAHEIVSKLVRTLESSSRRLGDLSPQEMKKISPALGPEILALVDPKAQVNRRRVTGGTAPSSVLKEIKRAERSLKKNRILKYA